MGRGSGAFSPLSLALFAAMEVQPDGARKTLINATILALVEAGVWNKLDALYLFAAHDDQAALLNWIDPGGPFDATAVTSPTFTVDEGYAGNGLLAELASYVNTNCNPDSTVHYVQDSACFGIWTRVVGDVATQRRHGWIDAGAAHGSYLSAFDSSNEARVNINGAFDSMLDAVAGGTGLWVGNRSGAAAVQLYHNGASVQTGTTASVALTAPGEFWLGARNFGGDSNQTSNEQFSASVIGGSLDATEQDALYDALLSYLQGVGAVA